MAFIGTPLDARNTFQSLQGKRFNGDGSTTAFTLDVAPSSTLDIEVFVGNVRQDPNSAYTLSGTTLTFTGAPPSGTNNIYVVHQAKSVGTIGIPDDTISARTLVTLDNDNDHVLIEDATDGELKKALIPAATSVADAFTINGSTPTLTIGDAGAEDTKIVFDGNAQDYHIGLDDSTDKLTIGLGSTLGTTSHMTFDSTGAILKPLQPAFQATPSSNSSDIAADTTHTIVADSEILDRNGDYNTSNGTFTAPVTGLYHLYISLAVGDYDHDNNYSAVFINTSNRRYTPWLLVGNMLSADGSFYISGSVIADMDANDTATFQFRNDQGAQQPFINQEFTFLGGMLLG
jgi:hypothetical protein